MGRIVRPSAREQGRRRSRRCAIGRSGCSGSVAQRTLRLPVAATPPNPQWHSLLSASQPTMNKPCVAGQGVCILPFRGESPSPDPSLLPRGRPREGAGDGHSRRKYENASALDVSATPLTDIRTCCTLCMRGSDDRSDHLNTVAARPKYSDMGRRLSGPCIFLSVRIVRAVGWTPRHAAFQCRRVRPPTGRTARRPS
jgi:hypothetical protein